MKTVGIIGGLGPETTSEFYLDVVFSCQKKDKTHRPLIIIASVPLPYKIEEDVISKNIGSQTIVYDTHYLAIGASDGGSEPFNGFIDELRIYNYARTAEQIKQDYNQGMSVYFK